MRRLTGKFTLFLFTLALLWEVAGCSVPPTIWYPTLEYSAIDQDLRFVVMSSDFVGQGAQWYSTLFYAVLAPQGLSGWQITPGPVSISDDRGPLGTGRGSAMETAGGVTLGALVIPPFRQNANALKIAFAAMEARNLATGDVRELKGDWRLVPVRNRTPDYGRDVIIIGVVPTRESGEVHDLTHEGTTLEYVADGGDRGFPQWVIGHQFWLSDPQPHDIFVLVTWEGEVRRVSADEYRQRGFTIHIPRNTHLATPDAKS